MHKILAIFSALILCCAGCTNNGDIGPLYGQWQLQSLLIDGEPAPGIAASDFSFKFQNDIVEICRQLGGGDASSCYGTWQRSADTLVLNFTHTSAADTTAYTPPQGLGLGRTVAVTHIEVLTSTRLVLSYPAPSATYTYTLKKLR